MISVNRRTLYGEVYNDVRCLSSDEKPTEGVKNGSTLIEIDTGKRYLYDALSGSWNEFSQGGGGEYVLPTMSQSVKGGATLGEGLSISGDSLSVDYSEVASVESLESATKLEADGGIKRTSNGLSVDYSEVASVDALEEATALSPTGGIVSTQDGLAVSPEQSSTGAIDGALLELTAKSKPATQASTVGKNLLSPMSRTVIDIITLYDSGRIVINGTLSEPTLASIKPVSVVIPEGTYTLSISSNDSRVTVKYGASGTASNSVPVVSDGTANQNQFLLSLSVGTYTNVEAFVQLEAGSTATPYEPYSGGAPSPSPDYPQPIVTVRGRNLIDKSKSGYGYLNSVGVYITEGQSSYTTDFIEVSPNSSYTLSFLASDSVASANRRAICQYDANKSFVKFSDYASVAISSTIPINVGLSVKYIRLTYDKQKIDKVQLTEGSTPQPYVPYGHVGLERRDSQGTLLSTTPIPLPSRGWVAGLPDGTADELTVDGAGKVTWSKACEEVTLNGGENWRTHTSNTATYYIDIANGRSGTPQKAMCDSYLASNETISALPDKSMRYGSSTGNALFIRDTTNGDTVENFESWLSTHPVTVLYPLATPVTETCGYIDLPDMQDCVLSIPELDALGVRYTIGDGAEIARQWYARAHSEYEKRITDLEEAVAELTAGA